MRDLVSVFQHAEHRFRLGYAADGDAIGFIRYRSPEEIDQRRAPLEVRRAPIQRPLEMVEPGSSRIEPCARAE